MRRHRGFTLIEVVIALFVIALGMGALLATIVSAADNAGHLRDKSLAEWIALNHISEVRLASTKPATGVTNGEVEFAGTKWRWQQTVSDPGMAGILRIDVSVAHADDATRAAPSRAVQPDASASTPDFPALTTAYGFVGTRVAAPSGIDPDWSLSAAAGGNPPAGGGQPGGATGTPATGTPTTGTPKQ